VKQKPGYPAQRGTFGHGMMEVGLRFSPEAANEYLESKRGRVPDWWIRDMEKISIEKVETQLYSLNHETPETSRLYLEAAFSLNGDTVEYLGQNIGRNYPKGSNRFNGSVDVLIEGEFVNTVVDFKFGSNQVDPDCKQLRFLGVLACEYTGKQEAVLAIAQFDKAAGMTLPDELPSVRLGARDLELAKKELSDTLVGIREARRLVLLGETPKVNPGEWCKWCETKGSCPEFKSDGSLCGKHFLYRGSYHVGIYGY